MSALRQPPLYSSPVPVSASRHHSLCLLPAHNFGFTDDVTSLPLTGAEFSLCKPNLSHCFYATISVFTGLYSGYS